MGTRKIRLSKALFDKLEEFAQQQGYSTIDECAAHLIEQAVTPAVVPVSEDDIKDRLRGLGYIE